MASGKCGENVTWTISGSYNDLTLTISGTGKMENYLVDKGLLFKKIPDEKQKRPPWDDYGSRIKKVIVEDGITSIGDYAFNLICLYSVTISDSVESIGDSAFNNCVSLTSITIPDSVTYIGSSAFNHCNSLTSIKLSDNVTGINYATFQSCYYLRNIKLPDSVKYIDEWAFDGCGLTSITIPNSVTYIDHLAFSRCLDLTSVTIPDSVMSIYGSPFDNCYNLREIHYPAGRGFEQNLSCNNNVKLIPYTPKNVTWKVEGITFTVGGTTTIKDYSKETPPWHDYLKVIQKIIIEDGVEKISANAFIDCIHLEHLVIPASIKTIGDLAFTISYCGERTANGGRNVIWSLDNGTLVLKKNPSAQSDSDFSIGEITWRAIEKNIKQIKIECGVMPGNSFFEWLWQSGRDVQLKLI